MKTLLTILLSILSVTLMAQVPQGVGYQGVATDSEGIELVNQSISIRASVLSGTANGTIEWEETHATSTDAFGLFTLTIGQGTNTTNGVQTSFADISWGTNTHYLKIEMDVTGGSTYSNMGTNQMMSVPYALYAETSGTTANPINSNLGGCCMPIMISTESQNQMSFADAMLYCDTLNESDNSDWVLPTYEQLSYSISGGCVIPDARSQDFIWSRSYIDYTGAAYVKTINLLNTDGYSLGKFTTLSSTFLKCRCVR